MEYAIQLLIPILLGLFLGYWLETRFGASPLWMVFLAIVGMVAGLMILYKRQNYPVSSEKPSTQQSPSSENKPNDQSASHDTDPEDSIED